MRTATILCAGPVASREAAFHRALADAARWAVTDGRLVVSDELGMPILVFVPAA